jgi:nitroreductase
MSFLKFLKKPAKSSVAAKRQSALTDALEAERTAALRGLEEFGRKKAGFVGTSPLLRRNIHRIEKGLCMPERRAVFAESYIAETVALFARLAAQPQASAPELKWAADVLADYFSKVDVTAEKIAPAHRAWLAVEGPATGGPAFRPYPGADLPQYVGTLGQPVDYPAFLGLARARRSQRWFQDRPVAQADIEAAREAALQAPSACNRQPFAFYCALNRPLIDKMADLPFGTAGFGHQLPALIAVVGDLSMYAEPRDRHLIYIDAALAAMQFMLAITALGLGSVPINWPDVPENHAAMRELLGLAGHQVPILLIGVGHPKPEAMIPYSAKRAVGDVLHVVS